MRVPILKLASQPTINDNPSPKECLWLDISTNPPILKSWDATKNEWIAISSEGSMVNTNPLDPTKEYSCWIGTKDEFNDLDSLDSTTWYIVKGVGQFIGSTPLFIPNPGVVYVNSEYKGKHQFGISWEYPFSNLQDALDKASEGNQIWVARGTYKNQADSDNSYTITKKVFIYGGFKGDEKSLSERSLKVKTILDGENKRRIINNAADNVIINGFTLQNGSTTGKGGAILSTRVFEAQNCEFYNNFATYGGAISGVTTVRNCLFIRNTANINGNSIHCTRTSLISACTLGSNIGPNAIYAESGVNVQIYNTVCWTPTVGGDSIVVGPASVINNCASSTELPENGENILLSRDNTGVEEGVNYPKFTSSVDFNFIPLEGSALIDKGIILNTILDTDINGDPRISGGSMDIGCYEYQNKKVVRTVAGKTGDVTLEIDDVVGLEDALNGGGSKLQEHINDHENPHQVTKEQVGLGNADNTSDLNKPVSTAQQEALDALKESLIEEDSKIQQALNDHENNKLNPHEVTKSQVGLDQVDNTSDLNKPVSTAQKTYIDNADKLINEAIVSVDNKLKNKADLDSDGKVPINQLPDSILGNVKYQGLWDVVNNEPRLVNGDTSKNGWYYIAINEGVQLGFEFNPGDWVINNNGHWEKVDNNDSVKLVNGKKGIVVIGIDDIPNLTTTLAELATKKELEKKANLGDDGKVPISELPSICLNNLRYEGWWDANNNTPVLDNGDPNNNGKFYVVQSGGTRFGQKFLPGDWIVNYNGTWGRVDLQETKNITPSTDKGNVIITIEEQGENNIMSASIDRSKLFTRAYNINDDFLFYIFNKDEDFKHSLEVGATYDNTIVYIQDTKSMYVGDTYYEFLTQDKVVKVINDVLTEGLIRFGVNDEGEPVFDGERLLRERDLSWNDVAP